MNRIQLFAFIALVFTACGFSETERKAAQNTCECSKGQTIEVVRDCIRDAAEDLKINVQAYSYDRAFKEVCPNTYQHILDFSKGKTKGRDEVPEQ